MKDPVSFARSEAPLVSVIIPSYNKRDYIVDTIASVQAQTYGNWELLVVDDVSTDGTVDLIREIAKSDPPDLGGCVGQEFWSEPLSELRSRESERALCNFPGCR